MHRSSADEGGKLPVTLPDYGSWCRQIKCQEACPVHTDARGYVCAIADGDLEKAYVIAREPNPFASICGRVCAAPCEVACRRGDIDAPVAIRGLKRFVTERYGAESALPSGKGTKATTELAGTRLVAARPKASETRNRHDFTALRAVGRNRAGRKRGRIAVIGAGVAGLTCAHDLALLGHEVTVFEAQAVPGGMLVLGVPEYRLPRNLVRSEIQAVLDLGVRLEVNQAAGRDFFLQDLRAQGFEAVFIAIGAHKSRELRMEGVELDGVFRAIEFLLNANLGFKVDLGSRVVVVGGGDVAMDAARSAARELLGTEVRALLEARTLDATESGEAMRHALDVAREAMRAGAKEIRVVCLESWEEMPATAFEKEEAVREGIKFFNRLGPRRILGASGRVTGLETLRVTRVFDEAGRFSPQFAEGSESVMECDSVILAVGQTSDLSWIQPEDGIAVTPRGTVQVDSNTLATTAPGVYAGGDAAFGPRIFIEGVANGHRAALSIHQYLTGERPAEQQRGLWRALDVWQEFFSEDPVRGPALPIRRRDYFRTPRHEPPALPIDRRIGIAEVELGYEPGQAAKQGARCLKCGINVIFDGSRCILCGGCVDICPEHCLRMVQVERLAPTRPLAALVERRYGVPVADLPVGSGTAMLMDTTKCIRCGLCALRCPTGTITLEQFTFSEGWAATPTE